MTESPRRAVRVLLLDESERVLLVRVRDGTDAWWWTPGGGVQPRETDEQAAHREIREETGLAAFTLGPCVWTHRHVVVFRGKAVDQLDRIYLARVGHFTPRPGISGPPEHEPDDMAWWSTVELERTADVLMPPSFATHLRNLLEHGPPADPMDIGTGLIEGGRLMEATTGSAADSARWPKRIGAITLFVDDLAAASRFYQDVFGLPVTFEDGDSVVFDFGNTLVNLLKTTAAGELIEPATVAPREAGSRLQLTIDVDDVDGTCAKLARRGVALLNGPMDRPWGVRTASFRDPGGHIWEIAR